MTIKYKTTVIQIIQIKEEYYELDERQSHCDFRCFKRYW